MEKIVTYRAQDGAVFTDERTCLEHEKSYSEFAQLVRGKIGEYSRNELRLGGKFGAAVVDSLPFTAPWMSALGSCWINVSDLRRDSSGAVEFQLADEDAHPYEEGSVWVKSDAFHSEWPR